VKITAPSVVLHFKLNFRKICVCNIVRTKCDLKRKSAQTPAGRKSLFSSVGTIFIFI